MDGTLEDERREGAYIAVLVGECGLFGAETLFFELVVGAESLVDGGGDDGRVVDVADDGANVLVFGVLL